MSKPKKPSFQWYMHSPSWGCYCDNPEVVVSVHTYGKAPSLSFTLCVAYWELPSHDVWSGGKKQHTAGPGWRYSLSAFVGSGFRLMSLDDDTVGMSGVWERTSAHVSRQEAIKAGLHEFIRNCDHKLTISCNSSKPWRTQHGLIEPPGHEQLAYYLCRPEWEPVWQLVDEVTKHDNWLAEVRAPNKTVLSEQLTLF